MILNDSEAQQVTQQEETHRVADANQRLADENCWLRDRVESLEHQVIDLTQQLASANQRAEETSKHHDTIVMQLTQQLDRFQAQLEDLRKPRRWWQ